MIPRSRASRPAGLVCLAAAAALLPSALSSSATAGPAQAAPPTRVHVVVIDGLRPDEVASMPFLASLAEEGTHYPEARAVMVAETIPNHVSMVTGVYPDRSGIVANDFPDVRAGESVDNGRPELLEADSLFTLVQEQCPEVVTAAVTSKDYLFAVMDHDRTGDGEVDADSNFANVDDPTFIPVAGLTPDERTIAEALRVSRELDPAFLFVNLGSVDRVGHVDEAGGATEPLPTGSAPAARAVQRTLTDTYLRTYVEALEADGRWDSTALIVTADHSMDWSFPTATVSLSPLFAADPLLRDQLVVAQNGGAGLYSLRDRDAPQAAARLARMREIAVQVEGVDEALYREPNPLDGGEEHWVGRVHPDWHQTHPRSGDLLVTVQDGLRVTEPSSTSNPIPGNHGMASTLRIPMVVAGGLGVRAQTVPAASSDPDVRDPRQAENVDVAATAAWLLGVDPPTDGPEGREGFDGRVLEEAFLERPADSCSPAALPAAADGGAASDGDAGPGAPAAPGPVADLLPSTGAAALLPVVALLAVAGALLVTRAGRREDPLPSRTGHP